MLGPSLSNWGNAKKFGKARCIEGLFVHDREECRIVVEDSERGLAAATAAGLDCLIVRTEWSKDGDFSKACCIVDSVADVSEEVLRRAG